MNTDALIASNQALWQHCEVLPSRVVEVDRVATAILKNKARYQEITSATKPVPWFAIGIIHEREASLDFTRQLGQGDPLSAPSRHIPKGRGPFHDHDGHDAFFWGAVDALQNCAPYAVRWPHWDSWGGLLTILELYNGTGYEAFHHECSPYLWGATSCEQRGKYIADSQFSAATWDTQIGCAALLQRLHLIDGSVSV